MTERRISRRVVVVPKLPINGVFMHLQPDERPYPAIECRNPRSESRFVVISVDDPQTGKAMPIVLRKNAYTRDGEPEPVDEYDVSIVLSEWESGGDDNATI